MSSVNPGAIPCLDFKLLGFYIKQVMSNTYNTVCFRGRGKKWASHTDLSGNIPFNLANAVLNGHKHSLKTGGISLSAHARRDLM